jgi:hypothetical protein
VVLDPAVTGASIDTGIGDVMPLTSNGAGSVAISPARPHHQLHQ